jgi:hypothetical protein
MPDELSRLLYCPVCLKKVRSPDKSPPEAVGFERCKDCKGKERELPDLVDDKVVRLFEIFQSIYTIHGGEWEDTDNESVVTAILLLAAAISSRGNMIAVPIPVPVRMPNDITHIDPRLIRGR